MANKVWIVTRVSHVPGLISVSNDICVGENEAIDLLAKYRQEIIDDNPEMKIIEESHTVFYAEDDKYSHTECVKMKEHTLPASLNKGNKLSSDDIKKIREYLSDSDKKVSQNVSKQV